MILSMITEHFYAGELIFFLVACWATWMTGRAVARVWQNPASFLVYSLFLAAAVRFLPRMATTTPLPDALSTMRHSNSHLALLTDADGAVRSMVTLEDLVEDLVGTVRDGTHRG